MAKKWFGTFSNIDDDFDLFAAMEIMDHVVLTSDRVAMDWHDDSDNYSVVLQEAWLFTCVLGLVE